MISSKQRFARLATSLALAATLGAGAAIPAFALTETGVTVSGATLSGGTVTFADFAAITLDGTQKTSTAAWSMANIVDSRGTGAGWNLALTLTQLKEYNTGTSAYVVSGKTLATSSAKVTTAPVVSLVDSTSDAASTITPVTTTTALDTGASVKLLSAALDGGKGSYSFSNMTSTLTVPANAFAATYKADGTVTLATAP